MNDIGAQVRALRKAKGWTLKELSARADVSTSLLSEIETGKSKPSIDTLYALAEALGSSIAALLAEPQPETHWKLASEQRSHLELLSGVVWSRLTPGPEQGIEFLEVTYPPGAHSGEGWLVHQGREWILILEGTFAMELGEEKYELKTGDTLVFDSDRPHRFLNTGTTTGRAIQVLFRPAHRRG